MMVEMTTDQLETYLNGVVEREKGVTGSDWRTGSKVGRTLYNGSDDLIGVMDTRADAALCVHARTDIPTLLSLLKEMARRVGCYPGCGVGVEHTNSCVTLRALAIRRALGEK